MILRYFKEEGDYHYFSPGYCYAGTNLFSSVIILNYLKINFMKIKF